VYFQAFIKCMRELMKVVRWQLVHAYTRAKHELHTRQMHTKHAHDDAATLLLDLTNLILDLTIFDKPGLNARFSSDCAVF